jgi:inorganic phosphate transporter, PiT family
VILGYVAFGYLTSMNQALVGAMIGTAYARQTGRVHWAQVRDILAGWAVGPVSGAAFGFAGAWVLSRTGWA